MAKKKKGKTGNRDFNFRDFCEDRGANPDGLSFAVTETHVDDLISKIKTLEQREIAHSEVYTPLYDTLIRLKDAKKAYESEPGRKWEAQYSTEVITRDIIGSFFLGMHNSLDLMVHVAKDYEAGRRRSGEGGFKKFKRFMMDKDYRKTIRARAEFMKSLYTITQASAKQVEQSKDSIHCKVAYDSNDIENFGLFYKHIMAACKHSSKAIKEANEWAQFDEYEKKGPNPEEYASKEEDPKYKTALAEYKNDDQRKRKLTLWRRKIENQFNNVLETYLDSLKAAYHTAQPFIVSTDDLKSNAVGKLFG